MLSRNRLARPGGNHANHNENDDDNELLDDGHAKLSERTCIAGRGDRKGAAVREVDEKEVNYPNGEQRKRGEESHQDMSLSIGEMAEMESRSSSQGDQA